MFLPGMTTRTHGAFPWSLKPCSLSGVITVLGRPTKWAEEQDEEPTRDEQAMVCFARNDKGITQANNDLSNPPLSAWEARTLPLSYARSLRFVAHLRFLIQRQPGQVLLAC